MKKLLGIFSLLLIGCGGVDGLQGPAGPAGPAGSQGDIGPLGPSASISSITRCSKSANSLVYIYTVTTYSGGAKYVTCEVDGGLIQTFTGSMYQYFEAGAVLEGCLVSWDLDAASGGWWTFSNTGSSRTAVYNDSVSASDGNTVAFATSDCTTN